MNKQHILGAITIALCLFAVYIGQEQSNRSDAFEQWQKNFGVKYNAEESVFRRMIFERNVAKIEAHNADKTQTYTMGINQFTTLTDAEFVANYLGSYPSAEMIAHENPEKDYHPLVGDVDWTSQGKVSPIKNQGSCGSCWAFSATGVSESFSLLKGQAISLS
jgi:C1A family cysteine protease